MNNFDVDNYSSFNRGTIVVDSSVKKLSNNIENILNNSTSKLAIAKAFLSLVDTNYQKSDNKNSSDIGGV